MQEWTTEITAFGLMMVALIGMAVGAYLGYRDGIRKGRREAIGSECRHEYGPVKVLRQNAERKPTEGALVWDVYDIMEARCRKCGKTATMTYNIERVDFDNGDGELVEYNESGRVTNPA